MVCVRLACADVGGEQPHPAPWARPVLLFCELNTATQFGSTVIGREATDSSSCLSKPQVNDVGVHETRLGGPLTAAPSSGYDTPVKRPGSRAHRWAKRRPAASVSWPEQDGRASLNAIRSQGLGGLPRLGRHLYDEDLIDALKEPGYDLRHIYAMDVMQITVFLLRGTQTARGQFSAKRRLAVSVLGRSRTAGPPSTRRST